MSQENVEVVKAAFEASNDETATRFSRCSILPPRFTSPGFAALSRRP